MPDRAVCACPLSTWEVDARGSRSRGHCSLHCEFKANPRQREILSNRKMPQMMMMMTTVAAAEPSVWPPPLICDQVHAGLILILCH